MSSTLSVSICLSTLCLLKANFAFISKSKQATSGNMGQKVVLFKAGKLFQASMAQIAF